MKHKPNLLVTRGKILVANFSFKNQNEENAFGAAMMAIFPLTIRLNTNTLIFYTPTTEKQRTNESNAGHIRSFMQLPNVSSQLYTFFCLYVLEKKCTRLKNCHLAFRSMFKTIFPFAVCQDDRPIAKLNIEIFHQFLCGCSLCTL